MRALLIVAGVLVLCVFTYFVAYAESEAYLAYVEFDKHRLGIRYNDAEKMASSQQVRDYFKGLRQKEKEWGGNRWWEWNKVNKGPTRRLDEEESLDDGRVRLRISQEVRRGPLAGPVGKMNVRERIDVVMVSTPEGWKVDEISITEKILERILVPYPEDHPAYQ